MFESQWKELAIGNFCFTQQCCSEQQRVHLLKKLFQGGVSKTLTLLGNGRNATIWKGLNFVSMEIDKVKRLLMLWLHLCGNNGKRKIPFSCENGQRSFLKTLLLFISNMTIVNSSHAHALLINNKINVLFMVSSLPGQIHPGLLYFYFESHCNINPHQSSIHTYV